MAWPWAYSINGILSIVREGREQFMPRGENWEDARFGGKKRGGGRDWEAKIASEEEQMVCECAILYSNNPEQLAKTSGMWTCDSVYYGI